MNKIYSRWRIKIPKVILYKKREKDKLRKSIRVMLIAIIVIITVVKGVQSIEPIFDVICEKEAKGIATRIANNRTTEVMKKYEYDDIFTTITDEEGNIKMVKSNIIIINKILSDVAIEIQNELDGVISQDFEIKLGNFTGSKFLSGRGPDVKFKILRVGNVLTEFKSEFKEAGVNQTLHRMYIEVKCEISILTPFSTISEQIVNQVIIAENIIVGEQGDGLFVQSNVVLQLM